MWADAFPALLALARGPQPLAAWVLLGPVAIMEAALVAAPVLALALELWRVLRRR
jgi:hypothetical protein